MKRILVTGIHSYIGNAFKEYMKQYADIYQIHTISLRNNEWKLKNFSSYDCIFHVAGLVHADIGQISKKEKDQYYEINTHLTIALAQKAKNDGVGQFIFMSSSLIYGDSAPLGQHKVITRDTTPSPTNFYGDSKLQAEKGIQSLSDPTFKVVIIRAPMIYGKNCKGNYRLLSNISRTLPIFPKINNNRSMIYIENLLVLVWLIIKNKESGIFWPQNKEYISTSEMAYIISNVYGKKMWLIPGLNWLLLLMANLTPLVNKAFGNLTYERSISEYSTPYRLFSLKESIYKTELK